VGGFEFLAQFSLTETTVRREGDEILLARVRMRDQTTGQARAVTHQSQLKPYVGVFSLLPLEGGGERRG